MAGFAWGQFNENASPKDLARSLNSFVKWLTNALNNGGLVLAQRTVVAAYSATLNDHLIRVDTTAGAITVTLPNATLSLGQVYVVKKIDAAANAVTVQGTGGQTIDGAATKAWSTQYTAVRFQAVIRTAVGSWDIV